MRSLTTRQRAKVNASLCFIHEQGFDAGAVTRHAQSIVATGKDTRAAYEQALNEFADTNPEAGHVVSKLTRVIEASSPANVAKYDQALSTYIGTRDTTAIMDLAPMLKADGIALAVREGELSAEQGTAAGLMDHGGSPTHTPQSPMLTSGEATQASDPLASQVSIMDHSPAPLLSKAQRRFSQTPYTGPQSLGHGAPTGSSFEAFKEAAVRDSSRASVAMVDAAATP